MVDHSKVSCANLEKLRNIFKALLCYKDSTAVSSEKQDNLHGQQEKLKQQMFLLEDKENE